VVCTLYRLKIFVKENNGLRKPLVSGVCGKESTTKLLMIQDILRDDMVEEEKYLPLAAASASYTKPLLEAEQILNGEQERKKKKREMETVGDII
jgi:hypothetical protein